RSSYGDSMRAVPSRFLAEIPSHLTMGSPLPSQARSGVERDGYKRTTTWESTEQVARVPERQNRFHSGQRVRHAKFGEGIVLASKLRGDDEEVDIKFASYGLKRLSANFANLST